MAGWQITNRVTINYPLHQKHVVRVRPTIVLSELFKVAVEQKNLDPGRYELRHPTQPHVVLDLTAPLSQYAISEVTVVAKQTPPSKFSDRDILFSFLIITCFIVHYSR